MMEVLSGASIASLAAPTISRIAALADRKAIANRAVTI
jgi:hypothetical protein